MIEILMNTHLQNGWWVEDVLKCSVLTKNKTGIILSISCHNFSSSVSAPEASTPADEETASVVRISDSGFLPHLALRNYTDVLEEGRQAVMHG